MTTEIETAAQAYAAELLLADDDPDDRFLILRALRRCQAGLSIATFRDGIELMTHLQERMSLGHRLPRLVLLDLNMPRMDGREVLRAVGADALLRKIPIAVLSTSTQRDEHDRSLALGAAAFVSKPSEFARLTDELRALINTWFRDAAAAPTVTS